MDRELSAGLTLSAPKISARQLLVIGLLVSLLAAALFTRFYRLGTPGEFYFDEIFFPATGQEILRGDPDAWEFIGHENTHPPLSKLFMAGGMALLGEDSPIGWRFFGALAGVGSVFFIYLLAKRLFRSEIAGLAAGFLMVFEGLFFVQSRIATPDTYLLFFILGTVYFLVSDRFLFSGMFFGAALAIKLTALLTVFPIVMYFLYRYWRAGQGKGASFVYLAPVTLLAFYLGTPVMFGGFLVDEIRPGVLAPDVSASVFVAALGAWMAFWALAPVAPYVINRLSRSGQADEEIPPATSLMILPLFFVVVPLSIYLLTYVPMLFTGHGLGDVLLLNRDAYQFHSTSPQVTGPEAFHPYSSPWDTWPIMMRPIFLYVSSGGAVIYSLGNPIILWAGLPALAFLLWQGLSGLRTRFEEATGRLSVSGSLGPEQAALLFVVLTYLAFLLPWAIQPRLLFIYHYLPSLAFLLLALAYVVHWLWQQPLGRVPAIVFLAAAALTFVYFYPHLAAVDVSDGLSKSYFWFSSWR
ncbi:MAG: glycosyltransferase family 39 protein [Chloroflexi bacterium]|nr:glycosyltransferase family 39 protein [Chloroflexota bacterium]